MGNNMSSIKKTVLKLNSMPNQELPPKGSNLVSHMRSDTNNELVKQKVMQLKDK